MGSELMLGVSRTQGKSPLGSLYRAAVVLIFDDGSESDQMTHCRSTEWVRMNSGGVPTWVS